MKNDNETVRHASTELTGARNTRELDSFLYEVIRHRAVASLVLSGDWQAIKADWGTLKGKALTLSPDDSATQHNDLIRKVLDFSFAVTLASGLARDPEQVSSTLVGLSPGTMPDAVDRAGLERA